MEIRQVPTVNALIGANWRKSSYSGQGGGDCVEIAALDNFIGIRDSKNPNGAALVLPGRALVTLLSSLG
jgi:hypothetical protein